MDNILSVKNLSVKFHTHAGTVQAVRNLSFDLLPNETLAIVGESGSGKSVTVRTILKLLTNNEEIIDGKIIFQDQDLLKLKERELEKIRGNNISIIMQDPLTSLDPTMKIGYQIAESFEIHHHDRKKSKSKATELLKLVGIQNAEQRFNDYPHQFSGGQRQRIVIASALINNPEILIADEPTTALDVTVQAQIINLIKKLQQTMIFITHDLGTVAGIADRIAVMYAGKIVEIGLVDEIFYDPRHPYTWGLLNSMPDLQLDKRTRLKTIEGTPPSLINPPIGDAFAPRNPYALKIDFKKQPPFFKVSPTHYAATWLLHPDAPKILLPKEISDRHKYYQELLKEKSDEPI
ncbi:ABC transporter ATP-binding protein [Xylocopilactobacillus apis]|uniref:ABC transporter ATP-binding protein n=1 Tax=Xylocopilactobacillus apis TaxID=2932183 RepID=A0AAU9D472_9LACO|nr:ABC transporter ATP-binding protein [Xylocopilactobacillus apis]BDR55637.1 ABC transporter ATP-binding protein [Xylocopilactobacillus apis]